ncbi:hypothetical protein LBA_00875 [Megavirus lba]|uniref:Ankyrin repeat protein n=1 Tax=Megavirus lba TaxID=1235314 RepID=L7Y728_9VIRU|nr:hypothetical protein LBA_00875 [Megavirus lba]
MYICICESINTLINDLENSNNVKNINGIYTATYNGGDDIEIHVTKIKYIHLYYHLGTEFAIINLPKNDPEFVVNKDRDSMSWYVNKYGFGKIYSLYDPKTYEKFGLNIQDNHHIMDFASSDNRVDILDWYIESGYQLHYSNKAINSASVKNNIDVLNWWLYSGLDLKYDRSAIDIASAYGNIDVLNWWLNSGLELKYSKNSVCINIYLNFKPSQTIIINTLNWWLQSGLEIKYDESVIDTACRKNDIEIFNWWINSGLELKYTNNAINNASSGGYFDILDKWLDLYTNFNIELKYDEHTIDYSPFGDNTIAILSWWIKSNLEIKYSDMLTSNIISLNRIDVFEFMLANSMEIKCSDTIMNGIKSSEMLNFWIDNNLPIKYSESSMDYASEDVLNMWFKSGLELKYSEESIDIAFRRNRKNILDWWLKSGLPIKHSKYAYSGKRGKDYDQSTIQWWQDSGLPLEYIERIIIGKKLT